MTELGALALAGDAAVHVGAGAVLVVRRVPRLHFLGIRREGIRDVLDWIGKRLPVILDVDELIEQVALLGHVSPLATTPLPSGITV